jgi:integrase
MSSARSDVSFTPRYPKLGLHKASGLRRAKFNGRDFYFGPPGDRTGTRRFERMLAEWLANGRLLPLTDAERNDFSVVELLARYWTSAKATMEADSLPPIKRSLRYVKRLYGDTLVRDFGTTSLKAVRGKMIEAGWSRNFINEAIRRIRIAFYWGFREGLVGHDVISILKAFQPLRFGEGGKERARVREVDYPIVERTLPHLPPDVATMVQLQYLTGARGAEIRRMRWCEIDRSGEVWVYRPTKHKTARCGNTLEIRLGPKAQALLLPFIDRQPDSPIFSPAASEQTRKQRLRDARRTPVQPSQQRRAQAASEKSDRRVRKPGNMWSRTAYYRAISRACKRAEVLPWHPHQLRHARATFVRASAGLEVAQSILGHKTLSTTQVYAERHGRAAEAFALTHG